MREAEDVVYQLLEPIPFPEYREYPDPEHLKGAMKRYRRRLVSHQHSLPQNRLDEMMLAKTPQEFHDAHAAPSKDGTKRLWHIAPRAGMNMRSLWKHGTIEFRHFPGTLDPEEVHDCAMWCQEFVRIAMMSSRNEIAGTPQTLTHDLWKSRTWKIPKFVKYDHELMLGFEKTKHK